MVLKIDKTKIQQWLARWMIKLRRIKSVTMEADELNTMLSQCLPETFAIPVPGAKGELVIQQAKITMPQLADHFTVNLFCALHVDSMANPIYRAHVDIEGIAWPAYDKDKKLIYLKNIQVKKITLVQDEYSLLKDTRQLISTLVPNPIRTVFGATMKTTLNILSSGTYREAREYLSIYMLGNKQKVLDFHKPELEKVVARLNDDAELQYQLNDGDFEEQLFAEMGKDIQVKNGQLHFIFHPDKG